MPRSDNSAQYQFGPFDYRTGIEDTRRNQADAKRRQDELARMMQYESEKERARQRASNKSIAEQISRQKKQAVSRAKSKTHSFWGTSNRNAPVASPLTTVRPSTKAFLFAFIASCIVFGGYAEVPAGGTFVIAAIISLIFGKYYREIIKTIVVLFVIGCLMAGLAQSSKSADKRAAPEVSAGHK